MVKQSVIRHPGFGRTLVMLLALAIVALAMATFSSGATAQEPDIDFRILKLDCEEDPGDIPDGLTPEGCAPGEGVEFSILVEGETEPLTCTTDADGRCMVQVESESFVTVTEDEATATEGFVPRENPIETQAVTEFAGAIFVNVQEDEPPTELPDTGSGSAAQAVTQGAAGILMVVATMLALGGTLVRRPGQR